MARRKRWTAFALLLSLFLSLLAIESKPQLVKAWRLHGEVEENEAAAAASEEDEDFLFSEKPFSLPSTKISEEQLKNLLAAWSEDAAVFFYAKWDPNSRHLLALWHSAARAFQKPSTETPTAPATAAPASFSSSSFSSFFSQRLLRHVPEVLSRFFQFPKKCLLSLIPAALPTLHLYHFDCDGSEVHRAREAVALCHSLSLPLLPTILFFTPHPLRHSSAAAAGATTATPTTTTTTIISGAATNTTDTATALLPAPQQYTSAPAESASTPTTTTTAAASDDSALYGGPRTTTASNGAITNGGLASASALENGAAKHGAVGGVRFSTDANNTQQPQPFSCLQSQQSQQEGQQKIWCFFFDEATDNALPSRAARFKGDLFVREALTDWLQMMRLISYFQQLLLPTTRQQSRNDRFCLASSQPSLESSSPFTQQSELPNAAVAASSAPASFDASHSVLAQDQSSCSPLAQSAKPCVSSLKASAVSSSPLQSPASFLVSSSSSTPSLPVSSPASFSAESPLHGSVEPTDKSHALCRARETALQTIIEELRAKVDSLVLEQSRLREQLSASFSKNKDLG